MLKQKQVDICIRNIEKPAFFFKETGITFVMYRWRGYAVEKNFAEGGYGLLNCMPRIVCSTMISSFSLSFSSM